MSDALQFSDTYMKLITKFSRNINRADEKKLALFFKNSEDHVCISTTGLQTFVHIDAPKSHAVMPQNEFGVTDLSQFCKYATAVGYPKIGSSIDSGNMKTSKGRDVHAITFKSANTTYRMKAADLGEFDAKYDRKTPMKPEKDTLRLAAQIMFTPELIKQLSDTRALIGSDAEHFCMSIDGDIMSIYMRGMLGQQGQIDVNPLNFVLYSNFETKVKKQQTFKLFSLHFFDAMKFFNINFRCEIRVYDAGDDQTIALKSYGEFGEDGEKINIMVACQEAQAAVMSNTFDIIL